MERIDEIGFGGLKLIQDTEEFCYGIDAVLLASYAKIKKNSLVIDLGTGTGILPLILSHKTDALKIIGVEFQQKSAELANRNVALNGLSHRIEVIQADIKDIHCQFPPHSFDAVISNPPYIGNNAGVKNRHSAKSMARHETTADLETFFSAASLLLKDRGDFFLVHRPSRLVDCMSMGRRYCLEPKRIRLVHPNRSSNPNIVLVHFVKNGRPELTFEKSLFVYKKNGGYTAEVLKIYEKED